MLTIYVVRQLVLLACGTCTSEETIAVVVSTGVGDMVCEGIFKSSRCGVIFGF